ncbi:MAG: tagaturonate reductase [Candidatus Accumulibacter sp.]|jgi:tagaturonate reductase|nr:tagaturonate reductase [Accumulibacter sp.]
MFILNRDTLAVGKLAVESSPPSPAKPVRILQIGDGNFLRAFFDWMVDVANGAGLMNGEVIVAQPLERGIAGAMKAQDQLFTVLLRGARDGRPVQSKRLVTCVRDTLDPYAQWDAMRAAMRDPALRFVVSNTTEAGIAHVEEPWVENQCPASFPAKVAALLLERFGAFGGSPESGLVFLPCELIEANGSRLREYVLRFAGDWKLPARFADWVKNRNIFCNTLVDRIVPGFPAAEAQTLYAALGYRDPLMVAAEPFLLWVIEGPAELAGELPLREAGLDVVWTGDLQPYRARKVRILNGAHTASALAAYRAGLDSVREMTEDPVVSRYLNKVMFDEIVPFVPLPDAERRAYAATVMERFANPYIHHELISIALNSVSKWRVRVLPTVRDYAAGRGQAPAGLAFSLAALLHFYRGEFTVAGGYEGRRGQDAYPIRDDADNLAIMNAAWNRGVDTGQVAAALLADARLWGEDLTRIPGLAERTAASLARIEAVGVKTAMSEL